MTLVLQFSWMELAEVIFPTLDLGRSPDLHQCTMVKQLFSSPVGNAVLNWCNSGSWDRQIMYLISVAGKNLLRVIQC